MRPAGRNRPSHLTWLAVLGAATAVIALATSTTSASAHQGAAANRLTCRGIISLSAIEKATQLSMSYLGRMRGSPNDWWDTGPRHRGAVPGSGCLYNLHNPDGAFAQFLTDGTVEVGYGESVRNWDRFRALSKHVVPNSDDVPDDICNQNAPESKIQLGYGSKAFVNTMDLVSCDDSDPTDYPELPTSYYLVTVLTKRHDLLTVGFYNASLAATEGLVSGVLKADARVF